MAFSESLEENSGSPFGRRKIEHENSCSFAAVRVPVTPNFIIPSGLDRFCGFLNAGRSECHSLGQHQFRRLSLPWNQVVWENEIWQIHETGCRAKDWLPSCLWKGVPVRKILLTITMCFLFHPPAVPLSAHNTLKTYIFINHTGDDEIGNVLTYNFKEAIARSARFTEDYSTYKLGDPSVSVEIVSVKDIAAESASAVSIIGKTSTTKCPTICLHQVISLGARRAESSGAELLADIDAKCNNN
jgi:hypothetical protein